MWQLTLGTASACLLLFVQSTEIVTKHGQWKTECRLDELTHRRECSVALLLDNNGSEVVFSYHLSRKAFVSYGIAGAAGLRVQVDSGKRYETYLCSSLACILRGNSADELLERMRTGSRISIELNGPGQPFFIGHISLYDFEAMYRRARKEHDN
jgi:invasion protein IalB